MKRRHLYLVTILLCVGGAMFLGGCKKEHSSNTNEDKGCPFTSSDSILYIIPTDSFRFSASDWQNENKQLYYPQTTGVTDSMKNYYLDINGDSIIDFEIKLSAWKSFISMSGPPNANYRQVISAAMGTNNMVCMFSSNSPQTEELAKGSRINGELAWQPAYSIVDMYLDQQGPMVYGSNNFYFTGSYIGILLRLNDKTYYGWLEFAHTKTTFTIKSHGVNLANENCIEAGQTQ